MSNPHDPNKPTLPINPNLGDMLVKVSGQARVSEKTITKFSEDKTPTLPKKAKRKKSTTKKATTTKQVKVRPGVLAAAKILCEGDLSRLKIISNTEVIVRNPRHELSNW